MMYPEHYEYVITITSTEPLTEAHKERISKLARAEALACLTEKTPKVDSMTDTYYDLVTGDIVDAQRIEAVDKRGMVEIGANAVRATPGDYKVEFVGGHIQVYTLAAFHMTYAPA